MCVCLASACRSACVEYCVDTCSRVDCTLITTGYTDRILASGMDAVFPTSHGRGLKDYVGEFNFLFSNLLLLKACCQHLWNPRCTAALAFKFLFCNLCLLCTFTTLSRTQSQYRHTALTIRHALVTVAYFAPVVVFHDQSTLKTSLTTTLWRSMFTCSRATKCS